MGGEEDVRWKLGTKGVGGGSELPGTAEARAGLTASFCGSAHWPSHQRCQSVASCQGIKPPWELLLVVLLGVELAGGGGRGYALSYSEACRVSESRCGERLSSGAGQE